MATFFDKIKNNIFTQVEENVSANSQPYLGGSLGPAEVNPFAEDPVVDFSKSNTSYSGSDCTVMVQLNNKLIVLGNLETFSHSTHRRKAPVDVIGRSHAKGFVSGSRVVAGSMIFIVFDRSPLYDVVKEINYVRNASDRRTSPLPDQLPPLDLILLFHNEYGHRSLTRVYGVEFVDEGQVHSINDLYTECTMSYIARDIDQMIAYDELSDFKNMLFERQVRGQFVDNKFTGLLEYKARVERELSDCEKVISGIDMETDRRAVAGVFTLSASYWLSRLSYGKDYVTREELNKEKTKQLKIKEYLLTELEKINQQVRIYEQNVNVGFNAQHTDAGNVQFDYLSHASK
ncbi:MAG: hypothetical protein M0R17_05505 [Candidatus Omnitrophica bacterium]|jgi:hypothetical protein|nr:hypothetical protein [Candidatus Omnitrophota bacterium]